MKVGTEDLLVHRSFEAILAIIAPANDHFSKRLCIWAEIRAPAVIFVTHKHMFPYLLKIALERHVGHKTHITAFSIKIEQAYSFEFWSLKWLVVMPKQLEARAYAQKNSV